MTQTTHRCPVGDCPAQVPEQRLRCPRHRRLVPRHLQRALYRAWRRGAGAGTRADQDAMRACIDAAEVQGAPATEDSPRPMIRALLARYQHPNTINVDELDGHDVELPARLARCLRHRPGTRDPRHCGRCRASLATS